MFARASLVTACFADGFGALNYIFDISQGRAEDGKDGRFAPRYPLGIRHYIRCPSDSDDK